MNSIQALPQVIFEADGISLTGQQVRALGQVRVQQRLSLPTQFELVFRDPPGPLTEIARLSPGTRLRGLVQGESETLFDGEVTAIEHVYEAAHGQELRVRGYDLLHRLRKRQTLQAYLQVTLFDLARELVADLGFTVEGTEQGPVWQRLIQNRPSDFDLLVELAEACGLYLYLHDSVLELLTLDGSGMPIALILGESLFEARIEVNGDTATQSAQVNGWNPLQAQTHEGTATAPRVGRDIPAGVIPTQVGGSGKRVLINPAVQDDAHASALAQAELDRRVAREVTLWGVAEGNPRLRPGAQVEIAGVAPSLQGTYVLTSVNHIIDERSGFVSEISTLPPIPHTRETRVVAAFGVVTRVDDPDNLGRIKVSLPTYGDVETEWMGVLAPGAGGRKGLVTLPDVGDHVLVIFADADPTQGIVLGGLYGTGEPPDSGVEGGKVQRYTLVTPGGQLIRLDDAKRLVHVEDSTGSFVELAPGKVSLHAAVDLQIEAPGQAIVIRGQTIDFEKA